jgi:hypothetical protein
MIWRDDLNEEKKRDRQGRFKPRMKLVGIYVPLWLHGALKEKAAKEKLPIRAIATAVFEGYVAGDIRVKKTN